MTLFSTRDERALENLRIINARFARKPRPKVQRGERQGPLFLRPGVLPPVVIAASNTRDQLKEYAQYVCTGVNDEATILQACLDLQIPALEFDGIGSFGTLLFLDGTYWFDDRLILTEEVPGKILFVGDGLPKWVCNFNTNQADGYCAMIGLRGGGANSLFTTIRFQNICFVGQSQSNAMCFIESTLTAHATTITTECVFTDWVKTLWWSGPGVWRMFHHNLIENCDFSDAAWHFESGANGRVIIDHNTWANCSGDMVSATGSNPPNPTLIAGNVQDGAMVANAMTNITYANNVNF